MVDIRERLYGAAVSHKMGTVLTESGLLIEAVREIDRLRFELKAKEAELEIADGEIERLKKEKV